MQPTILRVEPRASRYRFESLRHGDAIEVASVGSAQEMFRRWKKRTGRAGRLVALPEQPNLLFFLDQSIV
jgi:hypothetical protein